MQFAKQFFITNLPQNLYFACALPYYIESMKKLIFTLFALFALVCSLKSEVDFKIAFDETSDSPAAHQEPILSTKYAPLEAINISDENFEKTFLGARDEYLVVV